MKIYIYALREPATNEIRYIGQTFNPYSRLLTHISDKKDSLKNRWIQELRLKNSIPIFEILIVCDEFTASKLELKTTAKYIRKGCNLLNKNRALKERVDTRRRGCGIKVKEYRVGEIVLKNKIP